MGEVDPNGAAQLWFFNGAGVRQPVDHVAHHSRAGLAWGYAGNGPADAALSILTVATGDAEVAERHHQAFMREVVAKLPVNERFALPGPEVDAWLHRHGFDVAAARERQRPAAASPAGENDGPPDDVDRQAAALVARSRALDEREQRLREREARVDAMAVSVGLVPVVSRATSLPAEPVRRQLEALVIDTGDGVDELARSNGIDPTWASRVATGAITQVDLPHVRQVCEGLRCTPYDLWGPEAARSIAHAYGPDAWPADPEPLLPVDGTDSAPAISTDWPAPTPSLDAHELDPHVLDGLELVP
ncbi:MAG: DUF6166 domain-containing protein [Acidimicrobiales bacterium]